MPTISTFQQTKGLLPEAPPSTDVNPERFGKDSAALAQIGGAIGDFGSKLMATRKQAMESDAVAQAQSDATLKISKMEDDERMGFQEQILSDGSTTSPHGTMADSIKVKMEKLMEEQLKAMPTGDAQREYQQRMQPHLDRTYLQNLDWENKERAKSYLNNVEKRSNLATQDIYNKPTVLSTMTHLENLRQDIVAKTGTVIGKGDADKVYKVTGKEYARAMFDGLAESEDPRNIQKGRDLLKDMPPQILELLDEKDVNTLKNKFDAAEKHHKAQQEINLQVEKRALVEARDKAQNAILEDIYNGKGSIRDIISGKGKILDPDKKQTMIGVLKARANEPLMPNPNALRNVVMRIHADPGDPSRISTEDQVLKMYGSGELTWDQKEKALREVRGKGTIEGQVDGDMKKALFKQAESVLAKPNSMGIADPAGQENMAKFMSYAMTELEKQQKAGKPMRELLDANSKDYLGNKLDSFRKSPKQIMQETVSRMKAENMASKGVAVTPPPKDTVAVMDPNGNRGFIPAKNLDAALKRGYRQVK